MSLEDAVKKIQRALNVKGVGLSVDGAYGPKTDSALKNFDLEAKPIQPVAAVPVSGTRAAPRFVVVPGVRFKTSKYKTPSGQFEGLVVHYTVSGNSPASAKGVLKYLAEKGLGAMVMDGDGVIYLAEGFDLFKDSVAHAGKSGWAGRVGLNSYYAGMEICCMGKGSRIGPLRESKGEDNIMPGVYQAYTEAQEQALADFIVWARPSNPAFKLENVCGHDEARAEVGLKGDKSDPGASLSMTMPAYRRYLKSL